MLRRCIDILVSATALVLVAPLLVGIAILIWLNDGSPILYLNRRVGQWGVPFRIVKFRTMCLKAEQSGGSLTFQADPRITPLGRFLRRHKLDELPQLVNVLRGDMTLIGPRPEVLDWAERYTPEQREVFHAKPGLSDPVQLLFRHEQEVLRSAFEYELLVAVKVRKQIEYLRSRNGLTDLQTAVRTLRAFFPSKPSPEELAVYSAMRAAGRANVGALTGATTSRKGEVA